MKALYKLELLKWTKNPLNWIFGFGVPIILTLALGLSVGHHEIDGIKTIDTIFPQIVLAIVITLTLTSLPINISASRQNRQLKHLSMANLTRHQYLLVQFFFNYTMYFLVFLICFTIGISALNLSPTYQMILSLFFWPILFYICHFCLAITITNFTKTLNMTMMVTFIIFYLILIISGVALPLSILPSWIQYLQILTPTGCAIIILTNCANGFNQSVYWVNWIVYLIFFLYFSGFTYLAFKYFKWY